MSGTNGKERPEILDSLCELIIDELKNFSSSRRCISPSSLFEALSGKAEVLEVLASRDHIEKLKSGYIKILDGLDNYFGKQYRERSDDLAAKIKGAESLTSLDLLLDDIIGLVCECISESQEKKRSFARLVIEISAQLGEVERRCLGLIESTALAHKANGLFNSILESQITDLEISSESCEDVFEVREIVRAKLDTIKSALETKKAEDNAKELTFESTIQNLKSNLKEMQQRIERDQKRRKHLEHEILIDPLTGIANRRVIERHIRKEMKKHKRDKTLFSLIFIDIDDFKRVNDTYGHWVGDKCLQSLVGRMKQVLRESDLIARYGGDEFIVFLAGTERKAAQIVANKLSDGISKTCFVHKDSEIQLSVSIGLTQIEEGDDSPEKIFSRADSALYEAKNKGRDRVIVI